jgi:hypothetical protein
MAKSAKKTPDQIREEAKAAAEEAVRVANANRKKIGASPLSPRESIRVYQAALAQYLREADKETQREPGPK